MLFSMTSQSRYLSTSCFYLYPTVRCLSFVPFLQTPLPFTFTAVKWCLYPTLSRNHHKCSCYVAVIQSTTPVSLDVTLRLWWEARDDWMEHRAFRRVRRLLIDFSTTHLRLAPTSRRFVAITVLPLYASSTRTDTTLPCTLPQQRKLKTIW